MNDYLSSQNSRYELQKLYIENNVSTSSHSILNSKTPKSLYKYCSVSKYTVQNLKKNELTGTQPSEFNDIYDSTMHVDNGKKTIKSYEKMNEMLSALGYGDEIDISDSLSINLKNSEKQDRHFLNYLTNDFYVHSLTTDCSNILMWSHYANCNKGICIEYDFTECKSQIGSNIIPVTYLENPIDITELCDSRNNESLSLAVLSALVSKYKVWSYEKEWRIVFYFNNYKEKRIQFINIPTPRRILLGSKFIENYCFVKDNQSSNQEIKNEYQLLEEFLEYAEEQQIPLLLAKREIRSFEIVYQKISVTQIKTKTQSYVY